MRYSLEWTLATSLLVANGCWKNPEFVLLQKQGCVTAAEEPLEKHLRLRDKNGVEVDRTNHRCGRRLTVRVSNGQWNNEGRELPAGELLRCIRDSRIEFDSLIVQTGVYDSSEMIKTMEEACVNLEKTLIVVKSRSGAVETDDEIYQDGEVRVDKRK